MEITVIEKVYRGLNCVLYINGYPLVTNNNSILNEASSILKQLGYKITKKKFVSAANDEIPNNEVPFKEKLLSGLTLNVGFSKWTEYNGDNLVDYGYNLKSELFSVNTVLPIKKEIFKFLSALGANVTIQDEEDISFNPEKVDKESKTVLFIVYENSNANQWNDNEGFSTIEGVRQKLKNEGFFQTSKGWEKNPVGWSGPMKAYIGNLKMK